MSQEDLAAALASFDRLTSADRSKFALQRVPAFLQAITTENPDVALFPATTGRERLREAGNLETRHQDGQHMLLRWAVVPSPNLQQFIATRLQSFDEGRQGSPS